MARERMADSMGCIDVDDMRVLLTPTYDEQDCQVGESGIIWSADSAVPWSSDVSVAFTADGFRATINPPDHRYRYDADDEPLFAPGLKPLRITVERAHGISAQERHIVVSGLVSSMFALADKALYTFDAQQ